jgi:S1-C subfamily serine protease
MQNIYNSVVRISANNRDIDYFNPSNIIINEPSIGTGFFITPKYIITCAHVIDTAEKIYFNIPTLTNTKYEATIKGICPTLDLAILETSNYKSDYVLNIPSVENINIQDKIFVVGFPLGRDKIKVTQGIISGLQDGYIQIDSAINSGNSGGPLLRTIDSKTYVVGIISSKVVNADGVGYAIPIELLKIFMGPKPSNRVYNSCNFLAKFSNTSESRIKMINQNLNNLSDTVKSGYTICSMSKISPLAEIGLSNGDLIINFDNKEISNFGEIKIIQNVSANLTNAELTNAELTNTNLTNAELTNTNLTNAEQSQYKVDLVDYVEKLIPNTEYNITTYSLKTNKVSKQKIKFSIKNLMGIKKIVPFMDEFESITIGGLVLSPLTVNLIERKSRISLRLRKYMLYTERFVPKILVVNLLPTSPFRISENINPGDIITKINGSNIRTIADVKKIFKKLNTNISFITFETDSGTIDTIDIDMIKSDIEKLKA